MNHCRYAVALGAASLFSLMSVNPVSAQVRSNSSPADVKPAQAGSPAAHPTESGERDGANSTRSNDNPVTNRPEGRSTNSGSDKMREGNVDRDIAACLLDKNKAEVELGKVATEHAEHKDVKEFAEKMVKDHQKVVDKLERIVGQNEPTDRRSKIEHQINERCLENLKKELSDKSGREFDACYMGSQVGGHMEMAAALEVLSNESSGQLRDIVKEAEPSVKKHLSMAKDIMKQLDKGNGREASRDRADTSR